MSDHPSEHVEFDPDLNEVYEIGSEVEEYIDRPNLARPKKPKKSKEAKRRFDPNKVIIER